MADKVDSQLPIIWAKSSDEREFAQATYNSTHNGRKPPRRPRAVVKATTAAHIKAAVQLAISEQCRVSIRSGGHSWAIWSVREDAILIDLSEYQFMEYDEATQHVSLSPSTQHIHLQKFLTERGRFFPIGHCADVGFGGFLLQGGQGWNFNNLGLSCEQLVSVDVITAAGEELHASEDENPEILWMARGAGPGFPAIVTKFTLRTMPAPELFISRYFYPASQYKTAMEWALSIASKVGTDIEFSVFSLVPPGMDDRLIACLFNSFTPDKATAEKSLQAIHESRPANPLMELVCVGTTIDAEVELQAPEQFNGTRQHTTGFWIKDDADVASVMERMMVDCKSKETVCSWTSTDRLAARLVSDHSTENLANTCMSSHYGALYTVWHSQDEDQKYMSHHNGIMKEVHRHSVGGCLGDSDFQSFETKYWGNAAGRKLMELRKKWDPKGRICGYLDSGDKSGIIGLENKIVL